MSNKLKNRNRFVWTIVIILALIGIAAAVRRTLIVENIIASFSPPKYPHFDSGFSKHPLLTLIHIIPGTLFMISGPLIFIKKIQAHHFLLYKWIRILFFISAYLTGISALAISWTVAIDGVNETAAATLFGLFFALSSLSPHEFFGIAFWIGFTIHLIVTEAWIRNTRSNNPSEI